MIVEGCFLDITALCEREQLLEQALMNLRSIQEELITKTRLAALGELASGVAHDFRNLLTPIQAYTEELKELTEEVTCAPELMAEMRTCLEHIETASNDGVSLIKRLQAEYFPQKTPPQRHAPSDLYQLIIGAWHQALPRWKGVTTRPQLQVHFEPGVEMIIDSSVLRQACVNIFANGLYAIEQRVKEEPDARPLMEVALTESEAHIKLELRDHGAGMSAETLERCRESFLSTKGGQGSGLGSSMVTRSIERLGGTLELRSTLGAGTSVLMTLPRAE